MNDEFSSISGPDADAPLNGGVHNLSVQAWENEGGSIACVRPKNAKRTSHSFQIDDLAGEEDVE
jgi:hypothetical protein